MTFPPAYATAASECRVAAGGFPALRRAATSLGALWPWSRKGCSIPYPFAPQFDQDLGFSLQPVQAPFRTVT